MTDFRRDMLKVRIADSRPASVAVAAWLAFLIGLFAAYAAFNALAPLPHGAFPIFKPIAILSACGVLVLAGLVLQLGLLWGRLGLWLGALTFGLLNAVIAAVMLGSRVRAGMSPATAAALTPSHAILVFLSLTLLAILVQPSTRAWFFSARRLRLRSDAELEHIITGAK